MCTLKGSLSCMKHLTELDVSNNQARLAREGLGVLRPQACKASGQKKTAAAMCCGALGYGQARGAANQTMLYIVCDYCTVRHA